MHDLWGDHTRQGSAYSAGGETQPQSHSQFLVEEPYRDDHILTNLDTEGPPPENETADQHQPIKLHRATEHEDDVTDGLDQTEEEQAPADADAITDEPREKGEDEQIGENAVEHVILGA